MAPATVCLRSQHRTGPRIRLPDIQAILNNVPQPPQTVNTVALLGRAYSLLDSASSMAWWEPGSHRSLPTRPSSRRSVPAVPVSPTWHGVRTCRRNRWASWWTARGARIRSVRRPDPKDRRAKLIVLTEKGQACIAAGVATIDGIEQQLIDRLGERGHQQLRRLLTKLLDQEGA